ncbi:hypothetical protein LJ655_15065 [Paraburkholderia sp. MMS20-SJTN17]|uniref:OmpA-like domain-containing protein n=1 Tax=Paraburkholderia translucens TaxID=2886945 RepID=A0ABS8KEK9_9BURK|nr:hypothetical protein [Paraburkholderia sp. MMS20-SJTN17]MCC8403194.1 hypothetical protein [Paraburkholderia sp. MMS20-SJTN17]
MKLNYLTIAASLALLPCSCFAKCEGSVNLPSHQLSLAFEKNSSALENVQLKKLEKWARSLNANYAVQTWLQVSAQAQPDEDRPDDLAMARAVDVVKAALDNGLVKAPIEIKTNVGSFGNPSSYTEAERTVTLQLTPGCRNNCCEGN